MEEERQAGHQQGEQGEEGGGRGGILEDLRGANHKDVQSIGDSRREQWCGEGEMESGGQ